MTVTFNISKIIPLLQAFILIACGASWFQANAQTPGPAFSEPLSDEVISSVGKWQDRASLRNLGATDAIQPPPASLQLKPAESSWWGVLDAAGYVASAIKPGEPSNIGVYGKAFQTPPRVNSPLPPPN